MANEENSEKFLCPKCGKKELEDQDWGLKCINCGYIILKKKELEDLDGGLKCRNYEYSILREKELEKPWSILQAIRRLPPIIIYLLPIITYFIVLLVICCYMIADTLNMYTSYTIDLESLSHMVLYVIISLALLDLTSLISTQYLCPISKYLKGESDTRSDAELEKDDRRYIAKVITISVILVLMHTFHNIFKCPTTMTTDFAVFIAACLFGAAAVLIAVGLWKVLDSKGDPP